MNPKHQKEPILTKTTSISIRTGEHIDTNTLTLTGAQAPLIKAVSSTGVPTIVILSSGKPISEPWLSNPTTSALLQQFYPSEQGGHALADVLFGDHNPSGKLSVSFPRDVGSLTVFYDYLNSGRAITDSGSINPENGTLVFGHQYVLGSPTPWYPFGYGKSYSSFEYGDVSLDRTTIPLSSSVGDAVITVSVDVHNTSPDYDGTEVVQVYVVDEVASVVVPNRQLKGFEKAFVPAGETRNIKVPIRVEELGVWDKRMECVVERGRFVVMVGGSSVNVRGNATFAVV